MLPLQEVCGNEEIIAYASLLQRKLKVTDGMDVILEAENKCLPPIVKHFRKGRKEASSL